MFTWHFKVHDLEVLLDYQTLMGFFDMQPSSIVLEPAQQVEKQGRLTVACAIVVEFLGVVTPDKVKMRKVAQGVNKDVAEHKLTLPAYMAQRCQKAMTMNLN
eukprot:6468892-Amphidinium_carterae.4